MGFGDLFKSKQSQSTTNSPAGFVKPWLQQSAAAYGNLATPQAYADPWQATLNPMLSGAWDSLYGGGAGPGYMDQLGMYGDYGSQALMNLQGGFQFDQGLFDQTMANLMPGLQGSYDAATRDNNRALNWNTLPGLNLDAAMGGQQGSTKLGQQTALARGMTMDRNADIGASMYQNALNQAQSAGMTGGMQNMGNYANLAGMGMNAIGTGFDMNQALLNNMLMAGTGMQGYNQQGIDMARAQWDQQQMNPWIYEGQRLGQLGQIGSQFGTTTQTGSSSPGWGNIGLQLGSAWLGGGGGNPFSFGGDGLAPFDTSQYASMYKLSPFDTSQYAGMYR